MNPFPSGLMRHDGLIAWVGRRIGEFEGPVWRCLEILHGHEPAGVLLQHEEARMSIGKVKFAAGLQHGCDSGGKLPPTQRSPMPSSPPALSATPIAPPKRAGNPSNDAAPTARASGPGGRVASGQAPQTVLTAHRLPNTDRSSRLI